MAILWVNAFGENVQSTCFFFVRFCYGKYIRFIIFLRGYILYNLGVKDAKVHIPIFTSIHLIYVKQFLL